jgi:hypothetical protein
MITGPMLHGEVPERWRPCDWTTFRNGLGIPTQLLGEGGCRRSCRAANGLDELEAGVNARFAAGVAATRVAEVALDAHRAKMTGALRTMTSASGRRDCGGRAGRPAGTSTHGRRRSSRNGG